MSSRGFPPTTRSAGRLRFPPTATVGLFLSYDTPNPTLPPSLPRYPPAAFLLRRAAQGVCDSLLQQPMGSIRCRCPPQAQGRSSWLRSFDVDVLHKPNQARNLTTGARMTLDTSCLRDDDASKCCSVLLAIAVSVGLTGLGVAEDCSVHLSHIRSRASAMLGVAGTSESIPQR